MKAKTATKDLSKTLMVMLMTAGLVLCAATFAPAGERERHGRVTVVKESSWRGGKRVTVVKELRHHRHRGVKVFRHLPRGHQRVKIGHRHYYTHGGRYYEKDPRGFVSIAPPFGAWFLSLPIGSTRLTIGGNTYFRHQETYYRARSRGYVVVPPPGPAFHVVARRVFW